MTPEKDCYAILGIPQDADASAIPRAYEQLARRYQPDPAGEPRNAQKMRELNNAFDVLDDPVKRREYDRQRRARGHRVAPSTERAKISLRRWKVPALIAAASAVV